MNPRRGRGSQRLTGRQDPCGGAGMTGLGRGLWLACVLGPGGRSLWSSWEDVRTKGHVGVTLAFAKARRGLDLSQFPPTPAASLASPARCEIFSGTDAGPLGTVPRPTGLLPSQANGCFHQLLLLGKTAFGQMFHHWEIRTAKPEDGAWGLPTAPSHPHSESSSPCKPKSFLLIKDESHFYFNNTDISLKSG